MKRALGRILSTIIVASGWLLFGARVVLDLIGYSTIPEDLPVAATRLDQALGLLLSTPWWALLGFALVSTLWLIWVSWPRELKSKTRQRGDENELAESAELELYLDPEHLVSQIKDSNNIFDTCTVPLNKTHVSIHIMFDKPIIDPIASVKPQRQGRKFIYLVDKSTSRYCSITLENADFPGIFWFDFVTKAKSSI